jgi:hypothetical protein
MDLPRAVYSRDLKIGVMRELDAGSSHAEISTEPEAVRTVADRVADQR